MPSVVWLQPLDFCLHTQVQRLDSPRLVDEFIGAIGNRELQAPFLRGRVLSAFSDGSGVDEMIQGRPKVVNTISNNARPMVKRGLDFDLFDDHAVAGTVSVDLLADDVRIGVNPSLQFSVEGIGMFFRSPELDPATSKLRSEHTLVLHTTYDSMVQETVVVHPPRLDTWGHV